MMAVSGWAPEMATPNVEQELTSQSGTFPNQETEVVTLYSSDWPDDLLSERV